MAEPTKKLKILCLHGYRQNSSSFQEKMNGFRKSVKKFAELTFINAPHAIASEPKIENPEVGTTSEEQGCSWWFCDESSSFSSVEECKEAKGFKESINVISEAFSNLGPFDGILGFSQGAALAALVSGLKECNEFSHDFKFVILISGFKSLADCHQYLYEKQMITKSLHVIGLNDIIITPNRSEMVAENFQFSYIIYHDGGHYVPCHSEVKKEYIAYLKDRRNSINQIKHDL